MIKGKLVLLGPAVANLTPKGIKDFFDEGIKVSSPKIAGTNFW